MKEYKINNKIYKLDVFENIRHEKDAYLIGYLLGDGGFHKPTHKRNARIFVSSVDEYIIKYFNDEYCPNNTYLSKIPVNKKRNIISNQQSHVLVFSSKFSETFKKYGLLSLKKNRTFHNIPKKLFPSFLLGLFDADGNFSWGIRKDRNRLWAQFKITHQNLKMLQKLQRELLDKYEILTYVTPKGREDCYVLQVSKLNHVRKLMNIMYSKNNLIYNKRKFESWQRFK